MSDLLNISNFVDDPFEDTTSETPLEEDIHRTTFIIFNYFMYFTETLKFILSIIVFVADIYLFSTIQREKKKCRTKKLIMHYAICHACVFVCSPLVFILIDFLDFLTKWCYFGMKSIEHLSIIICFFFGFGLGIEWLMIVYNPKLNKFTKVIYNYLIEIFYGLVFLQFFTQLLYIKLHYTMSQFNHMRISYYAIRIILVFTSSLLLYCNYLKYKDKIYLHHKKAYGLIIANVIVFSWIPLYIFDNALFLTINSKVLHAFVLFLWFIPETLAFDNSLLILFVLGKYDIYFQKYYDKMFKKCAKFRDDEEYSEKLIDENFLKNNNTSSNHNNIIDL